MTRSLISQLHRHTPPNNITKSPNTINSPPPPSTKLFSPLKLHNSNTLLTNFFSISLSISITLSSPFPSFALPSLFSSPKSPPPPPPPSSSTTPFSQAKNLPFGLENGKIRTCPSVNTSCISTNPKSSNFDFPWEIPAGSTVNAIQKLQEAILTTQKNATIQAIEDTPNGQYLKAEVDGGFGRDVLEFLVKGDITTYRCMATKVTYVYPFTTAFGDSKGQQERMKKIVEELGWYAPSFDLLD